jgi:hypothetical protein
MWVKMLRHAFLIMAHGNPKELLRLITALDYPENDIFVHLDARWTIGQNFFKGATKQAGLTFTPRIKVVWGGDSMVKCELLLMKVAFRHAEYDYFHLLSGTDYPVKSHDYMMDFFQRHKGENFLQRTQAVKHPERIQMRCDQYHFLQNSMIGKKRNFWKYLDFASCYIQRFFGVRRFHGQDIVFGTPRGSMTRELTGYFVKNATEIARKYRWTYCADEVFCNQEIIGTEFENSLSPCGDLRYAQWVWFSKRDCSPRALTEGDAAILEEENILFARKFILPESEMLYNRIDAQFSEKR